MVETPLKSLKKNGSLPIYQMVQDVATIHSIIKRYSTICTCIYKCIRIEGYRYVHVYAVSILHCWIQKDNTGCRYRYTDEDVMLYRYVWMCFTYGHGGALSYGQRFMIRDAFFLAQDSPGEQPRVEGYPLVMTATFCYWKWPLIVSLSTKMWFSIVCVCLPEGRHHAHTMEHYHNGCVFFWQHQLQMWDCSLPCYQTVLKTSWTHPLSCPISSIPVNFQN